jgi:hypothetical protein
MNQQEGLAPKIFLSSFIRLHLLYTGEIVNRPGPFRFGLGPLFVIEIPGPIRSRLYIILSVSSRHNDECDIIIISPWHIVICQLCHGIDLRISWQTYARLQQNIGPSQTLI